MTTVSDSYNQRNQPPPIERDNHYTKINFSSSNDPMKKDSIAQSNTLLKQSISHANKPVAANLDNKSMTTTTATTVTATTTTSMTATQPMNECKYENNNLGNYPLDKYGVNQPPMVGDVNKLNFNQTLATSSMNGAQRSIVYTSISDMNALKQQKMEHPSQRQSQQVFESNNLNSIQAYDLQISKSTTFAHQKNDWTQKNTSIQIQSNDEVDLSLIY